MNDQSSPVSRRERERPPIIVKASVEPAGRSAFEAGFCGTMGVLLALFIVFVAIPAIISIGFFIRTEGMTATEEALHEPADRQRQGELAIGFRRTNGLHSGRRWIKIPISQ